MGTNYYLTTKNKDIAHEYFAEKMDYGGKYPEYVSKEYELHDVPDFYYEIHLNKLSCGWRPLFQRHKAFTTFQGLLDFCKEHVDEIEIEDEYGEKFTIGQYKKKILDHAHRTPEPLKWVYDISNFDKFIADKNDEYIPKKTLHTISCEPDEADIWIPFIHDEYDKTRREAAKRLEVVNPYYGIDEMDYSRDPDYPVDWVSGEFS